jgi:hypothetical protein
MPVCDNKVDSRLGDIVLGLFGEGQVMAIMPESAAGEIVRAQCSIPSENGGASAPISGAAWFRTASLRLKERT